MRIPHRVRKICSLASSCNKYVITNCENGGVKMFFMLISLAFIVISIFTIRRVGISNPYSKGFALAIVLSIVAVVCLAQNYTQSLISEANDGIGISNQVAYSIIGEDGWSQNKFRDIFEKSIYFTLILIVAYPVVLIVESNLKKKVTSGA